MRPSISKRNVRGNRSPNGTAFLNVPYDKGFEDIFLAYIAGLAAYGVTARAALEISGGTRRLERILQLIRDCEYSFHDLSRVEVDPRPPATPRFNMAFELGLTIGWTAATRKRHAWFVMETEDRRAEKSLSDLKGTDLHIHDGTPDGVFREISNALAHIPRGVGITEQREVYELLLSELPDLLRRFGARSCFDASVFRHLIATAVDFSATWAEHPAKRRV